jgi:hypothetical protein
MPVAFATGATSSVLRLAASPRPGAPLVEGHATPETPRSGSHLANHLRWQEATMLGVCIAAEPLLVTNCAQGMARSAHNEAQDDMSQRAFMAQVGLKQLMSVTPRRMLDYGGAGVFRQRSGRLARIGQHQVLVLPQDNGGMEAAAALSKGDADASAADGRSSFGFAVTASHSQQPEAAARSLAPSRGSDTSAGSFEAHSALAADMLAGPQAHGAGGPASGWRVEPNGMHSGGVAGSRGESAESAACMASSLAEGSGVPCMGAQLAADCGDLGLHEDLVAVSLPASPTAIHCMGGQEPQGGALGAGGELLGVPALAVPLGLARVEDAFACDPLMEVEDFFSSAAAQFDAVSRRGTATAAARAGHRAHGPARGCGAAAVCGANTSVRPQA